MKVAWITTTSEDGTAKLKQSQINVDSVFLIKDIHKFAPQGQAVNKTYIEVVCQVKEAARKKGLQLWASGNWLLNYDYSPAILHALYKDFW